MWWNRCGYFFCDICMVIDSLLLQWRYNGLWKWNSFMVLCISENYDIDVWYLLTYLSILCLNDCLVFNAIFNGGLEMYWGHNHLGTCSLCDNYIIMGRVTSGLHDLSIYKVLFFCFFFTGWIYTCPICAPLKLSTCFDFVVFKL